jgi:hypothetical protein
MAVFANTERMYEVLGTLFRKLMDNQEVMEKFVAAEITILFEIHDPPGQIWLTPDQGVVCGPLGVKPTVTMSLSGDSCHKFWLKQLSMPVALATRKIKAKGPIPKVLKLLPLLNPAYEAYPEIARTYGISTAKA